MCYSAVCPVFHCEWAYWLLPRQVIVGDTTVDLTITAATTRSHAVATTHQSAGRCYLPTRCMSTKLSMDGIGRRVSFEHIATCDHYPEPSPCQAGCSAGPNACTPQHGIEPADSPERSIVLNLDCPPQWSKNTAAKARQIYHLCCCRSQSQPLRRPLVRCLPQPVAWSSPTHVVRQARQAGAGALGQRGAARNRLRWLEVPKWLQECSRGGPSSASTSSLSKLVKLRGRSTLQPADSTVRGEYRQERKGKQGSS